MTRHLAALREHVVIAKFQLQVAYWEISYKDVVFFCIKSHILNCKHKSFIIIFVMLSCISFSECGQQKKLN
jgi:hypothetical protein